MSERQTERTGDTDKLIDLLMKERARDRARIVELEGIVQNSAHTDFCGCGNAKQPGKDGCSSCLAEMDITRIANATRVD